MRKFDGLGKVFAFTFRQQWRAKGFRTATILLALLLFLVPAASMAATEFFGGDSAAAPDAALSSPATGAETVFVADLTDGAPVDYSVLTPGTTIHYVPCTDFADASAQAAGVKTGLILVIQTADYGYDVQVILPEGSALTEADADGLRQLVQTGFQAVLLQKSGLTAEQLMEISAPVETEVTTDAMVETVDPLAAVKEILSFVLPYLNIMLLYFLVLFYGQSVANSVIMEKTSKLMDTFLVSVQPNALIFGKVLAIFAASVLQFLVWIVCLAGGFAVGALLVRHINPASGMLLLRFFEEIGGWGGAFSIPGACVALLLMLAGFLLYCALSAIGGAAAGKPEDLSSTNVLFTMVLLVSFFATIGSGALMGEMETSLSVLDLIPFTAILVTPSRVLLGHVPVWVGILALGLALLVIALLLMLAGKVYRMMSLYKGNPPSPVKLLKMLRGK